MEPTLKQLIFSNSFSAVFNCLNEIAEDTRHDLEKISLPLAPKKKPERASTPIPPTIEFCEIPVPKAPVATNKEIHKKAVLAKATELKETGVSPGSLLTKENMSKWIIDGKSYWHIAEETGASDAEVSAMAKVYGLQSILSKIVAGKKQKKTAF
jgi:hypothetical protein